MNASNGARKIKIGLDSGCAYIKVAYFDSDGEIIKFMVPSRVKLGKATVGIGSSGGITYRCKGETWSFNEHEMNTRDTRFDSYPYDSMNSVLSAHALYEAGFQACDSLIIASGLPLNQFFDAEYVNEDNIRRKMTTSKREINRRGAKNILMPSTEVQYVYPEALAGLIDISYDNKGNDISGNPRATGLVDIGGRTTDIAVAMRGLQIDPDFTSTIPIGYLDVAHKLGEYLTDVFDCGQLDMSVLEETLVTNKIPLFRGEEPIDATEMVIDAKEFVTNEITREVEQRLGKANHMESIAYFGGGAESMRESLANNKLAYIPEDPQFANARGYLKAMTFLEDAE